MTDDTRIARTEAIRLLARISLMPNESPEPDKMLCALDFDECAELLESPESRQFLDSLFDLYIA